LWIVLPLQALLKSAELMVGAGKIEEARIKYESYDANEWESVYFDEYSGGFVVIKKIRIAQSEQSKNEKIKFAKEYGMCKVLATGGNSIEFLEDKRGSYDIHLNDIKADLKKTGSHINIVNYAKEAIRKQGAEIVVFEFENNTKDIHTQLLKLGNTYDIHGYYYFSGSKNIIRF